MMFQHTHTHAYRSGPVVHTRGAVGRAAGLVDLAGVDRHAHAAVASVAGGAGADVFVGAGVRADGVGVARRRLEARVHRCRGTRPSCSGDCRVIIRGSKPRFF